MAGFERRGLGIALTIASASLAHEYRARAEAPHASSETCVTAAAFGQQQHASGKLRAALEAFKACSAAECTEAIRVDCVKAYAAVEAATPSVIVIVRDRKGHDVTNVALLVDDQPMLQSDARGIHVDPGMHGFRVEAFEGVPSEQRVFIHEGEKNRVLLFTDATDASRVSGTLEATASAQIPRHTVWPWLVVGTGAAGVVVGAVMTAAGWAMLDSSMVSTSFGTFATNAEAAAEVNHTGIGLLIGGAVVGAIGIAWHFLEPTGPAKTIAISPLVGPGLGGGSVRVAF